MTGFFGRAVKHAETRLGTGKTGGDLTIRSNIDWHGQLSMIDFLQIVGVHARVNTMMSRERWVPTFQ